MKFSILGVTIDNLSIDMLKQEVLKLCNERKPHYIVTVNPEFIMSAQHDVEFRTILNRADLAIADGFGIALAARRIGERLHGRMTGVDLMEYVCQYAATTQLRVYLLGAQPGVAEKAAARLHEKIPQLQIVGAESGYRHWHKPFPPEKIIDHINRKKADIIFVAFGHVKQEKWIYHALPQLATVRMAIGVGGAFDYLSGTVRRAPVWMRAIGLEWLFRLLRQPWRFSRIFTAVVRFSLAMLRFGNHNSS